MLRVWARPAFIVLEADGELLPLGLVLSAA